jgi:hypothetical protein
MDKARELNEAFRNMFPQPTVITTAEVVSVEGDTCTVKFGDGLDVPGVRLRATADNIKTKLLITPRIGSFVLIGSQSGDFRDGNVLQVEEPDTITVTADKMNIVIDVPSGKISVDNNDVSLFDLLQQLQNIITNLKVTTPAGPSTNLLPDSLQAVTKFGTDFKKLFKQ